MSVELWTPPTSVTVARHAFRTETATLEIPHGATLDEIIVAAGIPTWAPVRVWIDEWEISPVHWGITRPRPGRRVLIRAVAGTTGGGGDSNKTLRMVLLAVVIIAAIVVSVVSYGILTGPAIGMSTMAAGAISAMAAAAVSIGGQYAINALLPPPKPKLRDTTTVTGTPTYAITGTQNVLAPYQAVPRVYGRHRLYPPLAAHPVTAGHLTTQTLSQLFTLGYGPLQIEDIRIGETPVAFYEGVTLEVRHGWPGDPPLSTFPYNSIEEPLAIDLTPPPGSRIKSATRTITGPVDVIGIEIVFPRGLFRVDAENVMHPFGGALFVNGIPTSTGEAVPLLAQAINEQRPETLRFSYYFDVQAWGDTEWTLSVAWSIPEGWEGPERPNPVVIFDAQWVALRTTVYEDPIPLPGMAKIGLTLTATGQLTGVVNQLSCLATSILQVWTEPTGWSLQETRNPAWIYADVLTGSATARPVDPTQIDWPALLAWGADCDARGYTFDAVLDTQSTVFETLSLVAAAGRASFTMRDGTYSVVRDVPQTVPVQQFTPRNSTGFSATKVFTEIPHALKVRFINPAANWQQDEQLVYDDGFDAATATRFEGLELFGCTDALLAWRHGRYWLAAARLRPETYTLGVDIEHLVAQRGDLVHVQHDVPLWGYGSGRIVQTIGPLSAVTAFYLDELFDTLEVGTVVAVRVRLQDGTSVLRGAGVTPDPVQRTTLFGLDSPAANLAEGDLVSVGEMGSETVPCLIARIEAGPDLSARLTLVDLAPGIHSADTGPIPPFESYVTRVPIRNRLPPWPPSYVDIGSDELAMMETAPGTWMISIRVTGYAAAADLSGRLVPTLLELQFRPVGSEAQWQQAPPETVTAGGIATFYAHPVQEGRTYDLRLRAIAMPESVASEWALAQHTVVGEATPPPAPVNLRLDYTWWDVTFAWDYPTPPRDFPGGFRVRIAYHVFAAYWETGTSLYAGVLPVTALVLPVLPLGFHTLMVKAVDRAGHESVEAPWLLVEVLALLPATNFQLDLDQTHLRWAYAGAWAGHSYPWTEPVWIVSYAHAGFRLRYVPGVTGAWEDGWPLHDGLISDTRFALPPLTAGTYTFLLKTVDAAGYESRDAAILVTDLAGATPQNIVGGIDYGAAGFPGVWEGLHYEDTPPPPRLCNDLLADGPHWTQDSARYWSQDPTLYWGDIYGAGCYTITFVVPLEDAGTHLTLDWTGTGPWRVEYLTTGDSAFWAHHTPYFWEEAPAAAFWSQSYGAWQPWPGAITVYAQRYFIRWCTAGPEEACLTHVETVFDVADLVAWIDDWPLPAAPSRLPMNLEFREILNVQITVVQSAGQPVRVVDVLDKSTLGPLVQARLVDGTPTTAQIDAVLKGY